VKGPNCDQIQELTACNLRAKLQEVVE